MGLCRQTHRDISHAREFHAWSVGAESEKMQLIATPSTYEYFGILTLTSLHFGRLKTAVLVLWYVHCVSCYNLICHQFMLYKGVRVSEREMGVDLR